MSTPGPGPTGDDTVWSRLLRRIIDLSAENRNLRDVLRRVAEFVVETTGADVCFVHVVDRDAKEIVLMGATPQEFDELAGTIRLRLGEGLAGWVAEHGEPTLVEDKWNDPRYVYIPALRGEQFSSLVSVPLLRPGGLVVGVLNVHSRRAHHFAPEDVRNLGEVASLLAGIVENAVLHDQLVQREAELERFAARTIELQELDHRRIASDIHDGISQRLVSAWYRLRAAQALSHDPAVLDQLTATESLLSDSLDEARGVIVGLRPAVLDDLGLNAGITSVARSLGTDADIELDLETCALPPHVETALFRVTQEALQNVAKHARATRVEVRLREDQRGVTLTVADDGVGFDPGGARRPMSYGVAGMLERAALLGAVLDIRSRAGHGTTVEMTVPTARPVDV